MATKKTSTVWILLALFLTCCSSTAFSTEYIPGTVVDVFGDNITTIQIDGVHSLKMGDKIDLTYMAGVLPMAVGVYETTTVQGNVILCKPISTTMPVDKGMNVQIDILRKNSAKELQGQNIMLLGQEASLDQPNPAGMDLPSRDPRFNNANSEDLNLRYGAQEVADVKIDGEVVEVMGNDVRIKLTSPGDLRVGFAADLTYTTSSGMELPVGTWKVTSINKREIVASADDKNAKPRKGMKALVYMKKEKVSAQNKLPPDVALDADGFPKEGSLFKGENVLPESSPLLSPPFDSSPGTQRVMQDPSQWKVEENVDASQYMYANSSKTKKDTTVRKDNSSSFSNMLEERGVVRKYWLGVEIKNSTDVSKQMYADFPMGVIIVKVQENSAADRAGLQPGDMIHTANKRGVNNVDHFIEIINRSDGTLKLKLQRGKKKKIKKTIKLDKVK